MSASAELDDTVNMIPLIDCMFFLILFFMLVTRFTPDEQAIASVLPSNQGPGDRGDPTLLENPQINIAIYPAGLERGHDERAYAAAVDGQIANGVFADAACVRVGGSDPVTVLGALLDRPNDAQKAHIDALHTAIANELASREEQGLPRAQQHPIVVSCYSGLSWKYALLAYDAVRAYEGSLAGGRINRSAEDLSSARAVTFAPPLIRNIQNEQGRELEAIMHLR
ncbi:MAG: biopolymer transporter ExbD [Planctomycetes bacterium]|nr:biopolymer transporter ExbD [Planctomycetota bacterium]